MTAGFLWLLLLGAGLFITGAILTAGLLWLSHYLQRRP